MAVVGGSDHERLLATGLHPHPDVSAAASQVPACSENRCRRFIDLCVQITDRTDGPFDLSDYRDDVSQMRELSGLEFGYAVQTFMVRTGFCALALCSSYPLSQVLASTQPGDCTAVDAKRPSSRLGK